MKRCHHCSGRFGLTRRYALTFSGYVHFCSAKCMAAWRKDTDEAAKRQKFFAWLARREFQGAEVDLAVSAFRAIVLQNSRAFASWVDP